MRENSWRRNTLHFIATCWQSDMDERISIRIETRGALPIFGAFMDGLRAETVRVSNASKNDLASYVFHDVRPLF